MKFQVGLIFCNLVHGVLKNAFSWTDLRHRVNEKSLLHTKMVFLNILLEHKCDLVLFLSVLTDD